jgi:hypothetical protein
MVLASETCLDEELVASIVALSIWLAAVMLPWLPRSRIFKDRKAPPWPPYIYPRVVPSITMKH